MSHFFMIFIILALIWIDTNHQIISDSFFIKFKISMFLSRIYMFLTDCQNHSLTHSPIGLVHHYVVITLTSFFSSTPQMLQENWACLSTVIWSIFVLHWLAILKHTTFDFYTVPLSILRLNSIFLSLKVGSDLQAVLIDISWPRFLCSLGLPPLQNYFLQ